MNIEKYKLNPYNLMIKGNKGTGKKELAIRLASILLDIKEDRIFTHPSFMLMNIYYR